MSSVSEFKRIPDFNSNSLFPSLINDKNCSQLDISLYSERDGIIHKINNCLLTFCESTFYYSARLIMYDQRVGMFVKETKDNIAHGLYEQRLWCASDFTPYPRGFIVYSKENQCIANVANLVFMMLNRMIPVRFIKELDFLIGKSGENEAKEHKIYKVRRSSGEIQHCILAEDTCLCLSKPNDKIPNQWRLKVSFNDAPLKDLENLKSLKSGVTNIEKRFPLEDFCKLNNISEISINFNQIQTLVSSKSVVDLPNPSDEAIYNEKNEIYSYYRDNRESIQNEIMLTYFSKLQIYFDLLKTTFPDQIKMNII